MNKTNMYIQDKDDLKNRLDILVDDLDDLWVWDANHDDVINDELGTIQSITDQLKEKIKTI